MSTRRGSGMYFRMLVRAAQLRKGQALSALAAIIVAATAATAMLDLYVDVQIKLRKEFRRFGANIVVESRNARTISADSLAQLSALLKGRGLAVPFAYAVARMDGDRPVVVAGTEFDQARQLNPWWEVSNWPSSEGEALVGARATKAIPTQDRAFTLSYQGRPLPLRAAGTVRTGSGEDSRIYISLAEFQAWTGLGPSIVEVSASGSSEQVNALLHELQTRFPSADVHAVRQVTEGEANVLGKTRSALLWSSAFITATAALCVLATLIGWVFDRRRDFAIMKALGASDRLIGAFVAGEACLLGTAGAVLGFAAGVGVAAWIGRINFHAPVSPRFGVFPIVLGGAILVTLLSALLPLRLLRRIQPAMILRGE